MIVKYSKSFQKSVDKLSGKMRSSIAQVISEVKNAESLEEISDCKKITGFDNVYRIQTGAYRSILTFHVYIEGNTVTFEYLVSRGQAYDKYMLSVLRKKL
jgi:mRNA-degrading endonuclease RelE of RelBE toxin-antitoxin system